MAKDAINSLIPLISNLDAIAETLVNDASIRAYEGSSPAWITPQPAGRSPGRQSRD